MLTKFVCTHHLEHIHTRVDLHTQRTRPCPSGASPLDADVNTGVDMFKMLGTSKFGRYAGLRLAVTEAKR